MPMTLSMDGAPWPRSPSCLRAWKPAVLGDFRDDRHRRAARRALVLGAAGDVEQRVADDAGQDASHQRAGVARRVEVAAVHHGVTPAADLAGGRRLAPGSAAY